MICIRAIPTIVFAFVLCIFISSSVQAVTCPSFTHGGCASPEYTNSLISTESGGNYQAQAPNSTAKGRYQFLDGTRQSICNKYPVPCVDANTFLNCPDLQDAYFGYLVKDQIQENQNRGNFNYVGQTIGGVEVTESGIIAATHLKGGFAVQQWLQSGGSVNGADPNGTTVSKYMRVHGGHPMTVSMDNCGATASPSTPSGPVTQPVYIPTPPTRAESCSGRSPMCSASELGTDPNNSMGSLPPFLPDVNSYLRCSDSCNNAPSSTSAEMYYYYCSIPAGNTDMSRYSECCCSGDVIFGGINAGARCPNYTHNSSGWVCNHAKCCW